MLDLDPPALLAMPRPISTNALTRNLPGRGRVVTKEYTAWKREAARMLAAQRPLPRFAQPVQITIYAGEGGVGMMDSDNCAKAMLDALKAAGVIHDDNRKWVRRSAVVWTPGLRGTVIKIRPAGMDVDGASLAVKFPAGLLP
jgi:Holliday junction resolvase RusA-like endonuclease